MANLSNGVSFQVLGLEKLKAKLRDMRSDVRRKLLIRGAHAAADVYKEAAQSAAPVLTGRLKADIGKRVRVARDFNANIGVGVFGESAHIAAFVEYGHGPKRVRKGRRKRGKNTGELVAKPKPFMRPAFDTQSDRAALAAHEVILNGLMNG